MTVATLGQSTRAITESYRKRSSVENSTSRAAGNGLDAELVELTSDTLSMLDAVRLLELHRRNF